MVDLESMLNSLRVNRLNRLDFPTPESPIRTTVETVKLVYNHIIVGGVHVAEHGEMRRVRCGVVGQHGA